LAEVLSSLNTIASTSNIVLGDISFRELSPVKTTSKTKNQVPYTTIEVTINVEGSFVNIQTFVQEIEREIRIMDIKQLIIHSVMMTPQLSSNKTTSKTKNYNIPSLLKTNIILHTYYQP
jgi:Tfp pilus assembly protein PilO